MYNYNFDWNYIQENNSVCIKCTVIDNDLNLNYTKSIIINLNSIKYVSTYIETFLCKAFTVLIRDITLDILDLPTYAQCHVRDDFHISEMLDIDALQHINDCINEIKQLVVIK